MKTTALRKFQRLEAAAIWRPEPDAQRLDVIVSLGEATLTITDMRERVQAHWSLAAIARANPGASPAIYHPDADPGETLELGDGEDDMTAAIETLRRAISRQRPRQGRLRLVGMAASVLTVVLVLTLWLPGAAREHALRVVPEAKRAEIGQALLGQIYRVTGPPCMGEGGARALAALERRLAPERGRQHLVVVRSGVREALRIAGGTTLVNADLIEGYDTVEPVAGAIIAAYLRAEAHDPMRQLLTDAGVWDVLRLLATGRIADAALRTHAEALLRNPPALPPDSVLIEGFARWQVPVKPYAYARDITGETTLGLIEADPFARGADLPPILSDGDWLRLQGICGA